MLSLRVNGKEYEADVAPDTPLLWVLRDSLGFTSVKYGCGIAQCGSCTVLIDGSAERSCVLSAQDAVGSDITTIEGLPENHPVKQAWIEHQVPQCGYCQPGMMLQATDVLTSSTDTTPRGLAASMDDFICRCGTHPRALSAMEQAGKVLKKTGGMS